MLNDVYTSVSDGLLGLAGEQGEGIHVKIGVSSVVSAVPILINGNMTAAKIKETLGLSPLADKVMDSIGNGSSKLYCITVAASTDGTAGEVTKSGTGSGSLTVAVASKPYNAFSIIIKVTGQGSLNTALFNYSIDGGINYSDDITVPLTGAYIILNTGVTVNFEEGATPNEATSFVVGDTYSFVTTAPTMTNADVIAAIDKLKTFSELYELVHIVGESQPALWSAVSEKQLELAVTYHKPLMFVLEAYAPEANETTDAYVNRLIADRKDVQNTDIQVVVARSSYVGMDGLTRDINNAGIVCGLYGKSSVKQSIGKTAAAAGMGIKTSKMLKLLPEGIEEYIESLDSAKYLTFRKYDGLDYYYVTNARMLCPDGSDYKYAEDVRVKNKIIREVRKEALPLLQDDIDLTDQQNELNTRAKFLMAPLDKMVEADEISSANIFVPADQDIIVSEKMAVTIRYVSRGYIRSIDIDLGRTKPSAS